MFENKNVPTIKLNNRIREYFFILKLEYANIYFNISKINKINHNLIVKSFKLKYLVIIRKVFV